MFELGSYPTINSIEIQSAVGQGAASFSMVQIDGCTLVDTGVWNVSQNWSGGASSDGNNMELPNGNPPQGVAEMFDGNTSTYNSPNGSGVTTTTTFTGLPTGSIEIYCEVGGASSITTNGGNTLTLGGPSWRAIADTTLTSLAQYQDSNSTCTISGIKVDGAILVDAGAQYNTSQTWSDGLSECRSGDEVPRCK